MNTLEAGADAPKFNTTPIKKANRQQGPKTIFDADQLKAVRRQLIFMVSDNPGKHKGAVASIWVEATNPEADADLRKTLLHSVMAVLEKLVAERLIVSRVENTDGGRTYHNLYPREYTYNGKPISISAILDLKDGKGKPLNVHDLSYISVRERLLKGYSVAEALSVAPVGKRGGLAKALEAEREDEGLGNFATTKKK